MKNKDSDDNEGTPLEVPSLKVAAIQMHEMFVSFRQAGFTDKQALELTLKLTMGTMKD